MTEVRRGEVVAYHAADVGGAAACAGAGRDDGAAGNGGVAEQAQVHSSVRVANPLGAVTTGPLHAAAFRAEFRLRSEQTQV